MNPTSAAPAAAASAESAAATELREFLAFRLGADEYGIEMLRVHEIRSYERPSRVADAPEFVKGVINLRGVIVPIVDLRVRLQLQTARYDALTWWSTPSARSSRCSPTSCAPHRRSAPAWPANTCWPSARSTNAC